MSTDHQQPLSLSHLIIQLLLECTQDELIHNTRYINSLITSSAAFDANKHISDDVIKTIAQNCFVQGHTISQVSTTITNAINTNNRQLSKVFERISTLITTPLTSQSQLPAITTGLNLLQLFISHCDYPILHSTAVYIHQTITTFIKTQYQIQPTKSTLPTSNYLRGLHLLTTLYTRSATPGWTSLLQIIPSIRSTLDSLVLTAFRALQVPQDTIDQLDSDQFPEITTIMSSPISTLTPGALSVIEYILQLLLSLLTNNATLPMCKTHIPQIQSLIMLLVDLDIHSSTHLSTTPRLPPGLEHSPSTKLRLENKNRLLALMSQVFALSCYAGKFNDIKQTLTVRMNKLTNKQNNSKNDSSSSSSPESLLLPFPAELFLHGLASQSLHNQKLKSDANPTGEAKKANNVFEIDAFLNTAKADEEGNGILIDTTKAAANAITGGKGDLTLTGGVVTKDVHERKFQGSSHLLALKVAADDKIAGEFLTNEVQSTQQGIYNKQQQMLHLDLKRCVATMLITTIITHLLQILPPTMNTHHQLVSLQQSLQFTQALAGFDTNYPLAYQLCDLPPTYRTGHLNSQQLITSRTTVLLTLLESLFSVSPSSLQQDGQVSSAMTNLAWLGFGGPGSTFLQNTFRELSASHHQQGHNMKIRSLLTDNVSMNGNNQGNGNGSSGNNGGGGDDMDQIYITTQPTLPTSLAMTFGTQNEQWHTQQLNQQHFQFEAPLYRMLQIIFIIFEIEINSISPTKEIALLEQLVPTIQINALNLFQTITITAGKQLTVYINTFMTQLIQLYQSTTQQSRTVYLLGNHNLLILQQHLISTFSLLLVNYSATIFTPNTLSQLTPLVLFDITSYFHDLTRIQQQFRLIRSTQKDSGAGGPLTKSSKASKQQDENDTNSHNHSGDQTTLSLHRVATTMTNSKTFSFLPNQQDKLGFAGTTPTATSSSSSALNDHQQQVTIMNTPSIHHIVPHSLQFPTLAQQQQHEIYVSKLFTFLTQLFQTTTSSLLLPFNIFSATARILTTIIHSTLTPYGTTLIPIPQSTLLSLLSLLNALGRYKPGGVGSFSPLLGEAMVYFGWALHIPQFEIAQYAKECLAHFSNLLAPAMVPPSLPLETVIALNQLRDRAVGSLGGVGGGTVVDVENGGSGDRGNGKNSGGYKNSTLLGLTGGGNSNRSDNSSSGSTTGGNVPLTLLDSNNSFPLLLYAFQQGYTGGSDESNNQDYFGKDQEGTDEKGDEDNNQSSSQQQQSLDRLMISLYHTRVRTLQITNGRSNGNQFDGDMAGMSGTNYGMNFTLPSTSSSTTMGSMNGTNGQEKGDEKIHNNEKNQIQITMNPSNKMAEVSSDDDDDDDNSSDSASDSDNDDNGKNGLISFTATPATQNTNNQQSSSTHTKTTSQTHIGDNGDGDDDGDDDLDLDLDFGG